MRFSVLIVLFDDNKEGYRTQVMNRGERASRSIDKISGSLQRRPLSYYEIESDASKSPE